MKSTLLFLFAAAAFFLTIEANAADNVICESKSYQPKSCLHEGGQGARVEVLQQLSDNRGPCIQGQTFTWDSDSIHVTSGCRAIFRVSDGRGGGRPDRSQKVVKSCASIKYRPATCPVYEGRIVDVKVLREESRGQLCRYGNGFNFDANNIYVSNGCRAQFTVEIR